MSEPDYDARAEVEWADYLSGEEISDLAARLAKAERERDALREAAGAVVARWDTPLWKDVGPTADVINALRALLNP